MSSYPNQYSNCFGSYNYSAADSQYVVGQIATDLIELNNRRRNLAYANQIYGLPNMSAVTPQLYNNSAAYPYYNRAYNNYDNSQRYNANTYEQNCLSTVAQSTISPVDQRLNSTARALGRSTTTQEPARKSSKMNKESSRGPFRSSSARKERTSTLQSVQNSEKIIRPQNIDVLNESLRSNSTRKESILNRNINEAETLSSPLNINSDFEAPSSSIRVDNFEANDAKISIPNQIFQNIDQINNQPREMERAIQPILTRNLSEEYQKQIFHNVEQINENLNPTVSMRSKPEISSNNFPDNHHHPNQPIETNAEHLFKTISNTDRYDTSNASIKSTNSKHDFPLSSSRISSNNEPRTIYSNSQPNNYDVTIPTLTEKLEPVGNVHSMVTYSNARESNIFPKTISRPIEADYNFNSEIIGRRSSLIKNGASILNEGASTISNIKHSHMETSSAPNNLFKTLAEKKEIKYSDKGTEYVNPNPVFTSNSQGSTSLSYLNSYPTEKTNTIIDNSSNRLAPNSTYLSEIEASILRSANPIEINESDEITVLGQRGIWVNKEEVLNWQGPIPISQYLLNEDDNPEIITKQTNQNLEYVQELAIRYLRPPTPPAPGEIIIAQEPNKLTPPAPPLILRQQPARPETPEPLIIREEPPKCPCQVGRKVITISGKCLPPPPRKVVIERLAQLPSKPQSVIIERWLPFLQSKRRVIYQKTDDKETIVVKPKNVIVQWEAPEVQVRKEIRCLGVANANPAEYVQRYGSSLISSNQLPDFVTQIRPPNGIVLAAEQRQNIYPELEGDLEALKLVDLDREGLSQYKEYLRNKGYISNYSNLETSTGSSFHQPPPQQQSSNFSNQNSTSFWSPGMNPVYSTITSSEFNPSVVKVESSNYSTVDSANISSVISQLFNELDKDNNGKISVEEAEKVLLRLNNRLGRNYGENEVKAFFSTLDINKDGYIDLSEFKRAFEKSQI